MPPTERQRAIWYGLNVYVSERGAMVTSIPYAQPIRLEVPLESPLPDKLRVMGWETVFKESLTRIGSPETKTVGEKRSDLSASLIEAAKDITARSGLKNIEYYQADGQGSDAHH